MENRNGLLASESVKLAIQEAAYRLAHVFVFDKEAVVTEDGVQFQARNHLAGIQQGAGNAAGFMGRKQPVGGKVHIQHFGLDVCKSIFQGPIFRFKIKAVRSVCDMQVAVGVETVHKL